MLKRSGIAFPRYAEGNLFLYRPQSSAVRRIFRTIFDKCHEIERDQFIIPYAIHNESGVMINRWLPLWLNEIDVGHLKKHSEAN
jgi:hypothetical protein